MANHIKPPELEQFIVDNVQLTGVVLGAGSFGMVKEVKIAGARAAAKILHDHFNLHYYPQKAEKLAMNFVWECKLMSQLHHPNIVEFLGVCYLPESPLPVLLMEKLQINLDSLLETIPNISLDIKACFLIGTTQGVAYLHSHTPPIVHHDLSAKNILIDSGLTAKIADLGVAKIVNPESEVATMTCCPAGTNIYMPPETETANHNTAIDIFSFGVVSLFTLTQICPNDLKPISYFDQSTKKLFCRSEIERREVYILQMKTLLGEAHPLVKLTLDCLEYLPESRPSAVEMLRQLNEFEKTIHSTCTEAKLKMLQDFERVNIYKRSDCEHVQGLSIEKAGKNTQLYDLQIEKDEPKTNELQLQMDQRNVHTSLKVLPDKLAQALSPQVLGQANHSLHNQC